jgi:thymidylate synthase ThyX
MLDFGMQVKIVAHSVAEHGGEIVTFQLRYPRFIHAELMTHRVFSRNASSSRAIPVNKFLEQIRAYPATFVEWGKNEPGMQAKSFLEGQELDEVQRLWILSAKNACHIAEMMCERGAHKQIVNRVTEPYQFMNTIVTATEWDNWFNLRDHPDAQPEIRYLARMMKTALKNSVATQLARDEWHLPYITDYEKGILSVEQQIECSVARCARVSFLNHDGSEPVVEKDLKLYARLVGSRPLHASPAEHQAKGLMNLDEWSKNFKGFLQFRSLLEERDIFWR